jgi:hypothetical protein
VSYLIGVTLALLVAAFAHWSGFGRDRSFYPTVLIVVASYYVLFAVVGGSTRPLVIELIVMIPFAVLAVAGFKLSQWLVAAGLAAHGVMDFFHGYVVTNPGLPDWWPGFCLAYDVAAAGCLAWSIHVGTAAPSKGVK